LRDRFHSDGLIALGIVAFCGVVYGITLTLPDLPPMLSSGMGPAIFPRLLLGVMVVLAGVLALLARGKADEEREPIPAMVYWTALAMVAFMGVLWLAGMAVAMVSGMPAMVRARFGTPTIGRESMVGELGEAASDIDPDGIVIVRGASWRARTNRATPIATGEPARVVAIDGLTLEVEPEEGAARDYRERRGSTPVDG